MGMSVSPPAQINSWGFPIAKTRIGTNADDTLFGTNIDEIILAPGGNDYVDGAGGDG